MFLWKSTKMLSKSEIISRLEQIYAKIDSDFTCRHYHECCSLIIWFKPEEILIKDYMAKHQIEYMVWSPEEFNQHDMHCPYLKNDRCIIYPARPIVCRLQGHLRKLSCKYNKDKIMSQQLFKIIKREFDELVMDVEGIGIFYCTCNLAKS